MCVHPVPPLTGPQASGQELNVGGGGGGGGGEQEFLFYRSLRLEDA